MQNEKFYLSQCIEIAKKGKGLVSPNPMVGSLIVYKNRIIGKGYHEKYGMNHAEVNAINSVKEKLLLKQSTLWLSSNPLEVSVGWDAALERICTYGYFEHKNSDKRIWVFNTHFDHIGRISREKSSKLILDQINKLNGFSEPTVVMGDFNDLPYSLTIKTLNKKLDDAMKINLVDHIGPIGTFNGFNVSDPIEKRIDYIFVKKLEILSHQHLDLRLRNGNHISDHLPVIIKAKVGK